MRCIICLRETDERLEGDAHGLCIWLLFMGASYKREDGSLFGPKDFRQVRQLVEAKRGG